MTIIDVDGLAVDLDSFLATFGWRARAACRDVPTAVFYPSRGDTFAVAVARSICARCEVRSQCLDYALAARETVGVWGGTTELERRDLRARLRF